MTEPITATATAYAAVAGALLKLVAPIQDAVYKHLDRRSKGKRELADVLAKHLSAIARLFSRSANLLEKRDPDNQLGTVCHKLHVEIDLLEKKVMSRVLTKPQAKRFLKEGHIAAGVELAGAELLSSGVSDLSTFVQGLRNAAAMFRSLAADAKRKGTSVGK